MVMLLNNDKVFLKALEIARRASDHYSLFEEQQELLWIHAHRTLASGNVIVELGVCNGKTMLILAALAAQIRGFYYGIDHWGLESSKAECTKLLFEAGLDRHATLYLEDTKKAMNLVPERVSLLLIDAGHDEANVRADCDNWIPKVREGGIVAFHDFDPVDDPERVTAHWAVRYYGNLATGDEAKWETLGYLQGLMVRRRRFA